MNNILIYCSSRNNYEMLEGEILKNYNFEGFDFVNVDDNSSEEQKLLGRDICLKNNIPFIENKNRGLFAGLETVMDYAKESDKDYKFVIWITHDCYPITNNFFSKISSLVEQKKLDNFGSVGFNTVWRKHMMTDFEFISKKLEGKYCGAMGRCVLMPVPGVGWIRPNDFPLDWNVWGKYIAVESVVDMCVMFNIDLFNKCIVPDYQYHHFCWGDDIGLQFLSNGYYNLHIPDLYVYHDQIIKIKYGISESSARGAQSGDTYHFCEYDRHYKHWEDKWGFDRNWQRDLIRLPDNVVDRYQGSLLHEFMTHDYKNGPVKIFDI